MLQILQISGHGMMEDDVASESVAEDGATVVITQRVRADSLAKYEAWLGNSQPLTTLIVSEIILVLMVYVVMPRDRQDS